MKYAGYLQHSLACRGLSSRRPLRVQAPGSTPQDIPHPSTIYTPYLKQHTLFSMLQIITCQPSLKTPNYDNDTKQSRWNHREALQTLPDPGFWLCQQVLLLNLPRAHDPTLTSSYRDPQPNLPLCDNRFRNGAKTAFIGFSVYTK